MPFEGEKFEETPTPPEKEKEEAEEKEVEKEEEVEEKVEEAKPEEAPEEKPEAELEKEKIEEKEEKIEFPPEVVSRRPAIWESWETKGHLHPRFEGKSEKEILEELLEKKDYRPLNQEELDEFHHFMYTSELQRELCPNGIGYKHYDYSQWAIGRGGYESPAEEREVIERAKELEGRWEAQMKEIWGPGWLLNEKLYKSLSKEGKERAAKEILNSWNGFYTSSGVELDARLEKATALTNPNMVHFVFKPDYERSEGEKEKIHKARQKIYKEFAETKTSELELIEDDLSSTEKKLAEEIKRLEVKKYWEARGEK
jgi:hypothetical protein